MAKKIVLILFLIIVLAAGVFSAFWFYKTSQIEKAISALSSGKSKISVGNHKISGFPLKQEVELRNITIQSFEKVLGKGKITFDKIKLVASIFENNFNSAEINIANFIDANNKKNSIEFNNTPKINISFSGSGVSKISYQDNGYQVYDSSKSLISSSKANNLTFTTSIDDKGQISSRLQLELIDTTSMNFAKIYQNNYESNIIDGIKTGKIVVQEDQDPQAEDSAEGDAESTSEENTVSFTDSLEKQFQNSVAQGKVKLLDTSNDGAANNQKADDTATTSNNEVATENTAENAGNQSIQMALANNQQTTQNINVDNKKADPGNAPTAIASEPEVQSPQQIASGNLEPSSGPQGISATSPLGSAPATNENSNQAANNQAPGATQPLPVDNNAQIANEVDQDKINEISSVKNLESKTRFNVTVDIEQILTPSNKQAEAVSDPTKIAQVEVDYLVSYKINKLDIASDNFKVVINGTIKDLKDDTNISGFATIKIEKSPFFIDYIRSSIKEFDQSNGTEIKSFDLSYQDASVKFAYTKFLASISDKMQDILEEVAAKNQLSQNGVMVFDVRREKNLDFVINETPIREVVGKF